MSIQPEVTFKGTVLSAVKALGELAEAMGSFSISNKSGYYIINKRGRNKLVMYKNEPTIFYKNNKKYL